MAAYSIERFALNGQWAVGSILVAETWPARLRGLVLSANRSAWGVDAALAGILVTFIVTLWGWRVAYVLPAIVALLAVYVRLLCPESPYWVRTHDRKERIRDRKSTGFALDEDDRDWIAKAAQPGWRQLFLLDLVGHTVMATIVASLALVSYSTVGMWMPLFLSQQHGWDRRIRELLHLVGAVRHNRLLGRRVDDRRFWSAARLCDPLDGTYRSGVQIALLISIVGLYLWPWLADKKVRNAPGAGSSPRGCRAARFAPSLT